MRGSSMHPEKARGRDREKGKIQKKKKKKSENFQDLMKIIESWIKYPLSKIFLRKHMCTYITILLR